MKAKYIDQTVRRDDLNGDIPSVLTDYGRSSCMHATRLIERQTVKLKSYDKLTTTPRV